VPPRCTGAAADEYNRDRNASVTVARRSSSLSLGYKPEPRLLGCCLLLLRWESGGYPQTMIIKKMMALVTPPGMLEIFINAHERLSCPWQSNTFESHVQSIDIDAQAE
jgi:hypothetical protein